MTNLNPDVSNEDIYRMLAGEILPSDIHERRRRKKNRKEFQADFERKFAEYPTITLLAMRKEHYSTDFSEDAWADKDALDSKLSERAAIYAVLARRPHIPNKVEGENKRRKAATAHHGPKKKGGRTFKTKNGRVIYRGGRD